MKQVVRQYEVRAAHRRGAHRQIESVAIFNHNLSDLQDVVSRANNIFSVLNAFKMGAMISYWVVDEFLCDSETDAIETVANFKPYELTDITPV